MASKSPHSMSTFNPSGSVKTGCWSRHTLSPLLTWLTWILRLVDATGNFTTRSISNPKFREAILDFKTRVVSEERPSALSSD